MSYQSDIFEAIGSSSVMTDLIGDRFCWDLADGGTAPPYLVAQTISGDGETLHDSTRDWSFPLIQFACWAKTKAEAIAIMSAFRQEFEGVEISGPSNVSLSYSGETSTRDPQTKLYGEIIDYRASTLTN
jgi:hypothetical protein